MKLVGLIARGVRRELAALPLLPALFDKLKEKKSNVSDVSFSNILYPLSLLASICCVHA